MSHLLVIGGASSDIYHIHGKPVSSAGGAGMYTAMAAHRSGASVSMFAPNPDPMPDILHPVDDRLHAWLHGPHIQWLQ